MGDGGPVGDGGLFQREYLPNRWGYKPRETTVRLAVTSRIQHTCTRRLVHAFSSFHFFKSICFFFLFFSLFSFLSMHTLAPPRTLTLAPHTQAVLVLYLVNSLHTRTRTRATHTLRHHRPPSPTIAHNITPPSPTTTHHRPP